MQQTLLRIRVSLLGVLNIMTISQHIRNVCLTELVKRKKRKKIYISTKSDASAEHKKP